MTYARAFAPYSASERFALCSASIVSGLETKICSFFEAFFSVRRSQALYNGALTMSQLNFSWK